MDWTQKVHEYIDDRIKDIDLLTVAGDLFTRQIVTHVNSAIANEDDREALGIKVELSVNTALPAIKEDERLIDAFLQFGHGLPDKEHFNDAHDNVCVQWQDPDGWCWNFVFPGLELPQAMMISALLLDHLPDGTVGRFPLICHEKDLLIKVATSDNLLKITATHEDEDVIVIQQDRSYGTQRAFEDVLKTFSKEVCSNDMC